MSDPDQSREEATKYNKNLASQVQRWSITRAALAIALLVAGGIVWGVTAQFFWAVPLFITSGIFGVLWLDSHESLREIRSRRWKRLGPLRAPQPSGEEGNVPR